MTQHVHRVNHQIKTEGIDKHDHQSQNQTSARKAIRYGSVLQANINIANRQLINGPSSQVHQAMYSPNKTTNGVSWEAKVQQLCVTQLPNNDIQQLQHVNHDLMQTCLMMRQENDKLTITVQAQEHTISKLTSHINVLSQSIDMLKSQTTCALQSGIQEADLHIQTINALKSEIQEQKASNQAKDQTISQLLFLVTEAQALVDKKASSMNDMISEISTHKLSISELETERIKIRTKTEDNKSTINELKREIKKMKSNNQADYNKVEKVTQQLESLNQSTTHTVTELNERLLTSFKEITRTKEANDQLIAEVSRLRSNARSMNSTKQKTTVQSKNRSEQMKSEPKQRSEIDQEIEELRLMNFSLVQSLKQANMEITLLTSAQR